MITELHLLLPLLLVVARLAGAIAKKMGLPSVIGEIFAGLLFGPMWIGALPGEADDVEGLQTFYEFAQIGLCVLMFRVGLDTDIRKFLKVGISAASVAVAGVVLPFALGLGSGLALGWSVALSVFVGAALTATSIGVTAKVLDDVGGHQKAEGRIILGAAVLDDVLGLLLLAGIVAMVTPGVEVVPAVGMALVQAVLFIGAGLIFGPWLVRGFIVVSRWAGGASCLLVLAVVYLLLMSWAAEAIGLAMIIGAYAAGLAFGGHPEQDQLNRDLRPLIDLLTPLFFILIGASIDLREFNPAMPGGLEAWGIGLVLLAVAIVGKLLSAVFLRNGENKLAIGAGMMPRGEVGLVFAQTGLAAGLLDPRRYSIVTLVLVATTVIGPVLMRFFWTRRNRGELRGNGEYVGSEVGGEP